MINMTKEEALRRVKGYLTDYIPADNYEEVEEIIGALEQEPSPDCISRQEPCEDAVSREEVLNLPRKTLKNYFGEVVGDMIYVRDVMELPPVTPQPKTELCKDCKWWKDSDGVYRRGVGAESQCPINRKEVCEGNGYCFLFEPQRSVE